MANGGEHHVYTANSSHLLPPGMVLDRNNRVATINQGTPEYDRFGIGKLMDTLPIEKWLDHVLQDTTSNDARRGNNIRSYGLASAQNVGPMQEPEGILRYFGATVPRLLTGTMNEEGKMEPEIKAVFKALTEIGRILGADSCQPDFLISCPHLGPHMKFVWDMLGMKGVGFSGFSFVWQRLDGQSRIKRHGDTENAVELPNSVGVFRTLMKDGCVYRAGCVGYSRQSVSAAIARIDACKEAHLACEAYRTMVKDQEPYLLPETKAEDYWLNGVGNDGVLFTWDTQEKKLVHLALRTRASSNKAGNYHCPIVCAFRRLREVNGMSEHEYTELLVMVGHMCSYYTLSTVLNRGEADWDRTSVGQMKGGLIEFLFNRMIEISGCVTGGPGRRCLNFMTRDLSLGDARKNVQFMYRWLQEMRRLDPKQYPTDSARRSLAQSQIYRLAKNMKMCGVFSAMGILHIAALTGGCPSFMAEYSVISFSVTQNKKGNSKSTLLQRYLMIKEDEGARVPVEASRRSKASSVLSGTHRDQVIRHPSTTKVKTTECDIENSICESKREMKVHDLHMPGDSFFRLMYTEDSTWRQQDATADWYQITPYRRAVSFPGTASLAEQVRFKVERLPQIDFNLTNREDGIKSVLWDSTLDERDHVMREKISIGRKEDKNGRYYEGTITKEELNKYPGLLDSIKLMMIEEDGKRTTHLNYMERLQKHQPLMNAIRVCMANNERKRRPSSQDESSFAVKKSRPSRVDRATHSGSPTSSLSPSLPHVSDSVCHPKISNIPQEKGWSNCSWRVDGKLSVKYRVYSTSSQSETTLLPEWLGYSTLDQLQLVPTRAAHPLVNDAYCALVVGQETGPVSIPRLKASKNRRKRSKGSPNVFVHETKDESITLYRTSVEFANDLPIGIGGSCQVQDALARALGGKMMNPASDGGKFFWYFYSRNDADLHLALSYICVCGTENFFKRLCIRASKAASKEPKTSLTFAVGYKVDGLVSYYLIGRKFGDPMTYQLAIAVPKKATRSGRLTGREYAMSKKLQFVRLL